MTDEPIIMSDYLQTVGDWKLLTALPVERVSFTTTKVGKDQIAMVGGQYKNGQRLRDLPNAFGQMLWGRTAMVDFVHYTDQVTVWNIHHNRWSTHVMTTPRRRPAVVAWGSNTLLVCGGYARAVTLRSCETVYLTNNNNDDDDDDNVSSKQRQPLPDMMQPRDCARAVLYQDRFLIVLGGDTDQGVTATVEMLDLLPSEEEEDDDDDLPLSWTALPSMIMAREYFSAIIVNDLLIVAGGNGNNVEVMDLKQLFHARETDGQESLPNWKVVQELPRRMASMGAVAIASPNDGLTLILANGMKENSVHALAVPSNARQPLQHDGNNNEMGNQLWGVWSQLPKTKVPAWERDLVMVGDYIIAVGDTWIEGLQLASTDKEKNGFVLEPADFAIPHSRVATWVYSSWQPGRDSDANARGNNNNNSSWRRILGDPRLRNALISIVIIWFLFFRHQPPPQRQRRGPGQRLGRH